MIEYKPPVIYKPKIVVARYEENINWLLDQEFQDSAIIYNKGHTKVSSKFSTVFNKFNDPVYGREGETYLYHIITNYDKLDDYTIFTQGYPFDHCPYFIDIVNALNNYGFYKDYQPLTCGWKIKEEIPPSAVYKYDSVEYIHNQYPIHMEFVDENLNNMYYDDFGWYTNARIFRASQKIPMYSKLFPLLPYLYDILKINKPYCGFAKFNYGAIFGVKKENILQHDISFYENLYNFVCGHKVNGYILERMWYTIFSTNYT